MSATAAFGEQLDALGIWWPRGDGDALRDNAAGWTQLADLLDDIAAVLDAAATSVVENYRGEAATRFAALWESWRGPAGYLATTAADCRRIAAAVADFGTDIDVADRTLVRLIEQALAVLDPATGLPTPERIRWLHECSVLLGDDLAARIDAGCTALDPIAPVAPSQPGEIDRRTIDPALITWPGFGTPVDLGHVATTPVDFGAGEGTLPPELTPPPPVAPTPGPGGTSIDGGVVPPGGTTINIDAPGATINIATGTARLMPPAVDRAPLPIEPPIAGPAADEVGLDAPGDLGVGGGGGGGGGAGIGGFGGGLGGGGGGGFSAADVPPMPPIAPSTAGFDPVPISVDPPAAGPATAGLAIAGVAAGAAGVLGAAGRNAGGGRNAPFFPFMPMAGGMGGDEGEEPKRRRRR